MPEERLRSTSVGRWWLVWVSGGRKFPIAGTFSLDVLQYNGGMFDEDRDSYLDRVPARQMATIFYNFGTRKVTRSSCIAYCM
jgi:hypothetical protein